MSKETNKDSAHHASVNASALPISTKQSVEIASFIRNRRLTQAKTLLGEVLQKKRAVPFKRYNRDVGHKRGKIASGRYPLKATQEFLKLLNSLEANAEFKGLDTENLLITTSIANKASSPFHPSRHRGRVMKRTHVTIIAHEVEEKKDTKKKTKTTKEAPVKIEKNPEVKPAQTETKKEPGKEEAKTK